MDDERKEMTKQANEQFVEVPVASSTSHYVAHRGYAHVLADAGNLPSWVGAARGSRHVDG